MNVRTRLVVDLSLLAISLVAGVHSASAQVNVTTDYYDQARTGANLNETQLNTSNVNVNQFGKLWSYTVSGSIIAQPLYVEGVSISGEPSQCSLRCDHERRRLCIRRRLQLQHSVMVSRCD